MHSDKQVMERVEEVIRATLQLGDDVILSPNSDLVNEIGLDSIEAFESVAALHELLGVRISEDFDPRAMSTIFSIATYILATFDDAKVGHFLSVNVADHFASMHDVGELG